MSYKKRSHSSCDCKFHTFYSVSFGNALISNFFGGRGASVVLLVKGIIGWLAGWKTSSRVERQEVITGAFEQAGLRYECRRRDGGFGQVEDMEVIHTGTWPRVHSHLPGNGNSSIRATNGWNMWEGEGPTLRNAAFKHVAYGWEKLLPSTKAHV